MKTSLEKIRNIDQLFEAWKAVQENARVSTSLDIRKEVDDFAENAPRNLRSISNRLARKNFHFGESKGVPLEKKDSSGKKIPGKVRPIVISKLEARIVQRSILDVVSSLPETKAIIQTEYSFGGVKRMVEKGKEQRAAVPAAIECVLSKFDLGGRFVMAADIRGFFTKIQRLQATRLLCKVIKAETELENLIQKATKVELENLAKLKATEKHFPTHTIGVAQGNSLSPLLGNIALNKFDIEMNKGDCACIRYIDDFLIVAPTIAAARARMKLAISILSKLGMELSTEKSSKNPIPINRSIEFLGVELNNGFIRPNVKSQLRLLKKIESELKKSSDAMNDLIKTNKFQKQNSLLWTLKRVDGMFNGWAKHYLFCNDDKVFERVDSEISILIGAYLGRYKDTKRRLMGAHAFIVLGIEESSKITRNPLIWPKTGFK